MHKERSGSLGSARTVLEMDRTPTESSSGDIASTGDVDNIEDARKLVRDLRQKTRAQAQQIMAWRRAYKMQEVFVSRLQREKCDQLKALSSKLLLFESRLIRKQKDISTMLNIRENIIHRQQRIIETLSNRLIDNGLEVPQSELTELEYTLPDLDSLNDSDSAVVMEDIDSDSNVYHIPKYRNPDSVTVVRSISDAIDPNLKYTSVRRNNGFLRRPEILETVYSVEEDADNDNQNENKTEANKKRDAFARGKSTANVEHPEESGGQKERSLDEQVCQVPQWPYNDKQGQTEENQEESPNKNQTNQVKTYNRVMSNHRSVTKPKDVKYKRINKAKSKSLEELRGRLKNWVEQGSKLTGISLEHSQSYA
ncbi:uncharacterized protein LOC109598832 isoform X2 [Aethina tumida]|uniref:uncharacterized protein LOC109598832 isoform X2 n=1 Tax=Aethina tumida TaxID=116153 RepID=UPI002149792B|nr:uncharacterized protein LOC109598832 isoform X2 [Aethina tumida]